MTGRMPREGRDVKLGHRLGAGDPPDVAVGADQGRATPARCIGG